MVMVMGPTPPGTGVMAEARSLAAPNSTSPTSFFSPTRFTPTSITTAPSLIHAPLIISGTPTAAISTSACPTLAARSRVFEWHRVTVAFCCRHMKATGFPTMLERPTTTTSLPERSTPVSLSSAITPVGGAGLEQRLADHQAPDVVGMEAVGVLLRGDRLQHPLGVDLLGKGQMHQYAVD